MPCYRDKGMCSSMCPVRRKLKEECSWDQPATAVYVVLRTGWGEVKQCDILHRQLANSRCDCEQAPPSGKRYGVLKLVKEGS
jgi:hypothetical protein